MSVYDSIIPENDCLLNNVNICYVFEVLLQIFQELFNILSKDLSIHVTQKKIDTKLKYQIFVWWDQLKLMIHFQIIE